MPNIFITSRKTKATLRETFLKHMSSGDWVSTGSFYRCTKNAVKQDAIHAELMQMLLERVIVMRCIEDTGGPARTEFKLKGTGASHGAD